MEDMACKHLFPFERVPHGSRIIIYGAGALGRSYLRQMATTKYAQVIAMIDREAEKCAPLIVPVLSPERIGELSFSYAVIALRGRIGYREMERILLGHGVQKEQIIYTGERETAMIEAPAAEGAGGQEQGKAFEEHRLSLAFDLIGGLGDLLIQKKILTEIFRLLPMARADLYTLAPLDFPRLIYRDSPNVQGIYANFGEEYARLKDKYALALRIVGSGYVKIEAFSEGAFSGNEGFIERMRQLQAKAGAEDVGFSIPSALMFWQRIYKGQNAYTGFCYDGVFDIHDKCVTVPDAPESLSAFVRLGLERYVTVNLGNGESPNSRLIAKAWPKERFEALAALLKQEYPVEVVQIGAKGAETIKGTDRQFLGLEFGLIAQILKHSLLHIDIEGGMVHLASQLGTRCAVLFGPTPMAYYAYEGNINIQAGNCHACCGLYLDLNICARGLVEPECMYSITPEMVLERVREHMASVV